MPKLNDHYRSCKSYDFDYYDDKDCLDLSHFNNYGLYYLRKDAVKSVEKIRRVLEKNLEEEEYKLRSAQNNIERIKEKLANVTTETWI